jgi:hypothetical protein
MVAERGRKEPEINSKTPAAEMKFMTQTRKHERKMLQKGPRHLE